MKIIKCLPNIDSVIHAAFIGLAFKNTGMIGGGLGSLASEYTKCISDSEDNTYYFHSYKELREQISNNNNENSHQDIPLVQNTHEGNSQNCTTYD